MKKIILLVVAALSISSCSGDSDSPDPISNYLTVTINGEAKTFNTIEVIESPFDDENIMLMSASIDNNDEIQVTFKFAKDQTGENVLYDLIWYNDGIDKAIFETTSNFTVNSPTHLEGTFSGSRTETSGVVSEVFENGSFSINY